MLVMLSSCKTLICEKRRRFDGQPMSKWRQKYFDCCGQFGTRLPVRSSLSSRQILKLPLTRIDAVIVVISVPAKNDAVDSRLTISRAIQHGA